MGNSEGVNVFHHRPADCMAVLRDAPITLHYLAEGNANILYTISTSNNDEDANHHDQCCVLRIRKERPFTKPAIEAISAFKARIKPLFSPDHVDLLLEQSLFILTQDKIDEINEILKAMEVDTEDAVAGKYVRAPERRHTYHLPVEEEPHGILMPNLNHGPTTLLEFKPKWLVQSPSAPVDSRRCRTCALNLARRAEGRHRGRGDSGFCPWDLLSTDRDIVRSALEKIARPISEEGVDLVDDFIEEVQPALLHLQQLQKEHNNVGLNDFRAEETDFSVAMALRDCSVFLVLDKDASGQVHIVRVKFADLDLKSSAGGKLQTWMDTEEHLISSGAYTRGSLPGGIVCALERRQTS